MHKLSILLVLSSSITIIEVFGYNFKNSNNSPGGYIWNGNGYKQYYSQPQPVMQEEEFKDTEEDPEVS